MNIIETKKLLKLLFKTQIERNTRFCIEIDSGPGVGKSSLVKQTAEELSVEWGTPVAFQSEFLSTREQPDVAGYGLPSKDRDQSDIMVRTKAPWMPRADSPTYGILLLDEFRQAAPEVQKPAAELMLNGCVGESALTINWLVVAASNREQDRSGVHRSLAFIENRRMLIHVDPDLDTWARWAESDSVNIHRHAIAFAKAHPTDVFKDSVPDKSGPFCTPRTLVKMSYLIDTLPPELINEAAMGYMGEATGAKFSAFLRMVDELPTYEEIVAEPKKTQVPLSRPDACYAIMQMLAYRLTENDIEPVFTYLSRMGREFQIGGLRACLNRKPEIVQSVQFGQWIKDAEVIELVKAATRFKNQTTPTK